MTRFDTNLLIELLQWGRDGGNAVDAEADFVTIDVENFESFVSQDLPLSSIAP